MAEPEPHNASSYPHSTLAPSYNDGPNHTPYSTFSSTSYTDDPNHTPYNTFSSFKQIPVDNTVVSAYEVGIANGISAHPRNNLSAKNGQSVRKGEVVVPRERRSLARKPPSGAKLEYKTLGSISKSKSLSEINIINNRGNKILDSHAKGFDNSPLSHNKNTSEGFKHTVNNGDSCSITNYQNEGVNKTIIAVDNRNRQNVADAGQIDSLDDKDRLEHHLTDKLSEDLQANETESDRLVLFSKENGLNERKPCYNRRHSLQDGIGLQTSNLSKVDSSDIHRYRVAQGEKGKRYSKRRHLSLQNPPTTTKVTNENSESARTEHRASNLTENESEAIQSGNQSASSRRKLPRVPAKATVLPKHMSDVGEFIMNEPIESGQIGQTQKLLQLSEKSSIYSTKMDRDQSHSNVNPNMDINSGTANNQSHKHAKTSHSRVEANYLKSQQGQLRTKVVSKMTDYEINSSDTKSIPKSLPSHKVSVTQRLVKGGKGEINAQKDDGVEQTVDRANPSIGNANSGEIEDKFRKKLELLAKASHKKSKISRHKNVSDKSDIKSNSAESTEVNSATIYVRKDNEGNEQNFPSPANRNSAKVGSEAGGCETSINENEHESKRQLPDNVNEGELTSNTVFNFNQEVIQELTDLVMTRLEESRPDSEVTDYSDITENSVSENREIPSTASDVSTCVSSEKSVDPRSIESEDLDSHLTENHSQKIELEGRSFDGKDQGDESKETNHSAKTNTADITVKEQAEIQNKQASQKQTHVLRTPSYRKRVMARAKLRYGKKSQNFKECSCVRSDNGDIEKCDFCKIYEMKQRSRTSLGLGGISDSECSEIASPRRALTPELSGRSVGHAQNSPRSVRKVNVSPRVDVLLSSNLFKKHLQKHENLIHKHTMSYKRFGMQKSVSNLDLSEGFTTDTDQSYKDTASEISEPAQVSDFADDASERSYNVSDIPDESSTKPTNRRHSLTGDTTLTFNEYDHKTVMKKKSGDTLPTSFARSRSRPGIGGLFDNVRTKSQNRNYIPSFNEFKRQKGKDSSSSDNKNNEVGDSVDSLDSGSTNTIEGSDNACTSSVETIVEHNLHTVLEADERGSRENLLQPNHSENMAQNIPQKRDIVKPEVIVTPANPSQTESIQHRPRPKLKGKSRTLPNIDLSVLSDNSSDRSSDTSIRNKRRINAKRPRSVISKKSSGHDSDTPDTSDNSQIAQQNVSARPKLKGHGKRILRSESDTKYETEKGKPDDHEAMKSKGVHSRHLSLLEKGHNSVTFNLDVPNNDGSSERSSSAAGSYLSDSLYSESCVNETITSTYDGENNVNASSTSELAATSKDDIATSVLRSTSDACEITQEAARKRRERKERPYKSDPFSGTEIIPATKRCAIREERAKLREHLSFASSSREEILSFLDGVSQSDLEHGESFPSLEELSEDEQKSNNETDDNKGKLGKHPSNVSSLSTDSGVIGQEESSPTNTLSHSMSEQRANWYQTRNGAKKSFSASCSNLYDIKNHGCHDCNNDGFHHKQTIYVCTQCEQRRIERKKIIQEVIDTEVNYGRDLVILQDEFYKPMLKAGLLTKDQLDCIFLNLDELIHVNKHFITKLKAAINHSNQHDDEDLQEVMIGSLFLESSTMFLTFENYCVNQAQAPILLEQLEREKELLRIFLHVSQSDNHLLRRMHLKSFLMVPVQRIMKYPLLLDRLYKVTIDKHRDKEALREAKEKIEDILGHINAKSKSSSIKQRKGSEKHYSVTEKIEVSRVALETLGWNRKDVCDVITTRLQITQPLDHMWAVKKCKNHKFTTVHGVLLSLIQPSYMGRENEPVSGSAISNSTINNNNNNYNNNNNNKKNTVNNNFTNSLNNGIHIQSAAVVLIKEKNGRYQVAREPFMLEKCVVSQDPDYMDVFELLEWNRESYLIKAETPTETKTWVQHLRRQMQDLGYWRKRRNALPNILLNHLS